MRSRFSAFEGEIAPSCHIKIGMNIGRTGELYHQNDHHTLEAPWRRNGITVNLPGMNAIGRSSAITMLGLAIDPALIETSDNPDMNPSALEILASRVTMDAVAARQFRSLFSNAELHGCSTAFFEQEVTVFLQRLTIGATANRIGGVSALEPHRLRKVREFVEDRLSEDISVSQMAQTVQMDLTNFAKAFHSATGTSPYVYLTRRRMEYAKALLLSDKSVTEVALTVNYANPSKFAAAFRRCIGQSPTQWKGQHGG